MTDRIKFTLIGMILMIFGAILVDVTFLNVTGAILILFAVLLIIGAIIPDTKP